MGLRHRRSAIGAVGVALMMIGSAPAAADTTTERIVYIQAGGSQALAVTDPEGGSVEPLTGFLGNLIPPRLSPDGGTIAYVRTTDQDGQGPGLWLIDVDGSGAKRIRTHETFQHAQMLAWSPDGSLVAWARWVDDRIRLVDRDGQSQGTIKVCTDLARPRITGFDWGRDGRLWVGCHAEGSSTHRLRVIPASGGAGTQRHRSNEAVVRVRVDPAGARALVQTTAGTTLLVRPTDKVTAPALSGAWAWSPSGTRLVGSAGAVLFTIGQGGGNDTSLGIQGFVPDWGPVPALCGAGFQPSNGGKRIIGTPGDDVLGGTPGNDVICGLGGDDEIHGFGGDDWIDGGPGRDELSGGPGDDGILGGPGRDTIDGLSGDDTIDGGSGNDILDGWSGRDSIFGGLGNDTIRGGSGHDILDGGAGGDDMYGDAGNDDMYGGTGDDLLVGDDPEGDLSGDDTLRGGPGEDVLLGGKGTDKVYGEDGDDALDGKSGNDTLVGGPGDDVLRGGSGRDRLAGNGGSDTLRGGSDNDHLTGGSRKDRLEGEGGNDTLIARDGVRDVVRGGPGTDKARIDAAKDDVTGVETLLP